MKSNDYDIIYDDDSPGEMADVVTIKNRGDVLVIELYHLKYAGGGKISNQIVNLYEVCGQAQKSVRWKHKTGKQIFSHLLKRKTKTRKGKSRSRIEKGDVEGLEKMKSIAKNEIPIQFKIYIVQPSISKAKVSDEILTLLGVTENFIKETAAIDLGVIASN